MAGDERLICLSAALLDSGKAARFEVEYFGEMAPAFVIRFAGRVRGYLNRCGHMPMELDWREGEVFDSDGRGLICSTHGATYAPDTGSCLRGPCFRAGLIPVPVEERDGRVILKGGAYDRR